MVKEKLYFQMATSTKVNIRMDEDMDSGNTNLSIERQGNELLKNRTVKMGKLNYPFFFALAFAVQIYTSKSIFSLPVTIYFSNIS